MWPWRMTIPCPEKAMHWLHMTPSITAFPFLPAGRGITYCNDEQVEMVRPLKAYDVIEVERASFSSCPCAGEQFQWNEE